MKPEIKLWHLHAFHYNLNYEINIEINLNDELEITSNCHLNKKFEFELYLLHLYFQSLLSFACVGWSLTRVLEWVCMLL